MRGPEEELLMESQKCLRLHELRWLNNRQEAPIRVWSTAIVSLPDGSNCCME